MRMTAKRLFTAKYDACYDYAISLARIVGMLFIVACHIANHFNNAIASQFFNVGVPLFFVVSGSLYADREIVDPKSWIRNRLIRLYMPLLAWFLFSLVYALILQGGVLEKNTMLSLALMLVNLQGLSHLIPGFMSVDGPWFFTVIMICYLLLIPWKKLEKHFHKLNSWYSVAAMAVICVAVAGVLDLSGPFYFFSGYVIAKLGYINKNKYHIVVPCTLIIGSCAVRLIFRKILDGNWFYDKGIVLLCHFSLAIGILLAIKWLRSVRSEKFDRVMSSAVMHWLDAISVYVYCFHGPFIAGGLSIFALRLPDLVSILLVYLATFAVATAIYIPFETLGSKIKSMTFKKTTS